MYTPVVHTDWPSADVIKYYLLPVLPVNALSQIKLISIDKSCCKLSSFFQNSNCFKVDISQMHSQICSYHQISINGRFFNKE